MNCKVGGHFRLVLLMFRGALDIPLTEYLWLWYRLTNGMGSRVHERIRGMVGGIDGRGVGVPRRIRSAP